MARLLRSSGRAQPHQGGLGGLLGRFITENTPGGNPKAGLTGASKASIKSWSDLGLKESY